MGLVLLGLTATADAQGGPSPDAGSGPTPVAQPAGPHSGTVTTVAGPGYCPGPASVDPASVRVGALAVSPSGKLFVDTGLPSEGLIATVEGQGQARTLRIGVRLAPDPVADQAGGTGTEGMESPSTQPLGRAAPGRHGAQPASRLASDGATGALVAAGNRVVHLDIGVTPVAGNPSAAPGQRGTPQGGDGGPALQAEFGRVASIAGDEAGNLFVADELDAATGAVAVRFVNRGQDPVTFYAGTPQQVTVAPGEIDTIAGQAGPANQGDGGPALQASLVGLPPSMAVAGGRLYLGLYTPAAADDARAQAGVRMVNLGGAPVTAHGVTVAPGAVETVAGGGFAGYGGDGQPALQARFGYLPGLAADGQGDLYLADHDHHRVRRVDADGVITTVAGTGGVGPADGGFDGKDQPATATRLHHPYDVAVGPGGRVYVSDRDNGQVRFIDAVGLIHAAPGNGVARTWRCHDAASAGAGSAAGSGSAGSGSAAVSERPQEGEPVAVAADSHGTTYVALSRLGLVVAVDASGAATLVAGGGEHDCQPGAACPAGDGGPAPAATLTEVAGLALGPQQGLYVLEAGGTRVRYVNRGPTTRSLHGIEVAPGAIATVAGSAHVRVADTRAGGAGTATPAPGTGIAAASVAVAPDGTLLLAEPGRQQVRAIDVEGATTTLLGPADPDDPLAACCVRPTGVAVDDAGNVYVRDARVWYLNRGPTPVTVHGVRVPAGEHAAVAGSGQAGFGGDGGPALQAQFQSLAGIAVGPDGVLHIADPAEHTVRSVDADGLIDTTVGTGNPGFNGDGLKARLTALQQPVAVAVDACGNLLVADRGNDRVRRVHLGAACPALAQAPTPPGQPPQVPERRGLPGWALPAAALASVIGAGAGAAGWARLRRR